MNLEALIKKVEKSSQGAECLTTAELRFIQVHELKSGLAGEIPFNIAYRREKALQSPSFFITDVVDDFYKQNFEPAHYRLCDEIIGPYLLGETVTIDKQQYDPMDYIGMLVLMSRDTFKSSIAGLMLFWKFIYFKLKKGMDLREMYCHEVIDKAIERGEVIRQHALYNARFRETFPEFRGKKGEWDRTNRWNWPSKKPTGPTEYSFIAYGESSKKNGWTLHWTYLGRLGIGRYGNYRRVKEQILRQISHDGQSEGPDKQIHPKPE